MIHYRQIFRADKNIGLGYNIEMEMLPEGAWACFTDGDTCQVITDYGIHLGRYIEKYPDVAMFTCMTNRVGQGYHLYGGRMSSDHNILNHKEIGGECIRSGDSELEYLTDPKAPMSGVLMLINRDAWKLVGGFKEGCLGVDNDMHRRFIRHGLRVGLMKQFYIYHLYRGHKHHLDTSHLK